MKKGKEQKDPVWQLIRDKTKAVVAEGDYFDCLAKFHGLCGFSFSDHRKYTFDTYSIVEKKSD